MYKKIVQFVAYVNLLVCFGTLLGWYVDNALLKSVIEEATPMKFNSAIAFVLISVAFLCAFSKEPIAVFLYYFTAIVASMMATITLSEFVFEQNLGVDQLFFKDHNSSVMGLGNPGRMSPATATCFFLLGAGLLCLKSDKKRLYHFVQYAFHFVTLTGGVALIGYIYRIPLMYKMSSISSMAIHTSFLLIISSIGASFINPKLGLTGLFLGKGMGNTMARTLFPAATLILLVLGFLRIETHRLHFVSVEFGIAIFTASFLLVILVLVIITANQLNVIDAKRLIVEESYLELNKHLEAKIIERTSQLYEVKERFEMATQSAEIGIWEMSLETKAVQGNEFFYKFLGFEKYQEGIDQTLCSHIKEEDKPLLSFTNSLGDGKPSTSEVYYRVFFPDQSIHHIRMIRSFKYDALGHIERVFGASIDVTAQVKFEEELNYQYRQVKAFVKEAPAAMAMLDRSLRVMAVSDQWLKDYHHINTNVVGVLFEVALPGFADILREELALCLTGESIKNEELKFGEDEERWIKYALTPWYDVEGKVGGAILKLLDITRQKKQELELIEAKERLTLAAEVSGVGIYDWDLVQGRLNANEMMCRLHGRESIPPMEGRKIIGEAVHPDDRAYLQQYYPAALDDKNMQRLDLEYRIVWPDTSVHHIRSVGTIMRDEDGKPLKIVGTNIDITLQKTAAAQLQKGYDMIKTFIEGAPTSIAMFDTELCYLTVSNYWLKEYKLTEQDVIGKPIYDVFPDLNKVWAGYLQESLQGRTIQSDGEKFERANGTEVWVKYVICPWYDSVGAIGGLIINTTNITEQKNAVDDLIRVKERLQLATEATRVGVWDLDVASNKLVWDDQMYKLYGVEKGEEDSSAEVWLKYMHPDDLKKTIAEYRMSLEGLMEFDTEFRVVTPLGNIRHIKAKGLVQKDVSGVPVRMVGTNIDITQQKVQLETLRQSEERYFKMVNEVQDYAIILLDHNRQVENWNYGAEKIFEYTAAEVLGGDVGMFFTQEEQEDGKVDDFFNSSLVHGRLQNEGWRVRRNGALFLGSTTITALHGMDEEIIGFSVLIHDLTERKKAELSEKMEAKNKELEQITYIASHDLQEPLRTISGIVNIMNQQYLEQLDEDADKYLKFMKDASERMKNLIKGLLDYSRMGKGNELTYFDVGETVSEISDDLAVFIAESKTTLHIDGQLPYLRGYKTEFRLLLQNLISNAIKFRKKDVNPEITISVVKENNCWRFALKDNGIGIDPKYQEKIFMIFQRLHNRSEYEGTGIGLSHCKKIVELHGGKIWVDSYPDKGSTFYFTIPN